MSLLEDVFLQDEANEAEALERVIEGDEFEERRRSDSDENSEKEDEAEEDKRRVDPTKIKTTRVVKNPRFILNPARLTGPRGIQVIPEHFKDFKFKGKGHEKEDLDLVLKRLEHWAYRLYPKFQFEDCLKKIEMLGKKRPVAVHLHKIRSDQFLSEDTVVQKDSSDEETPMPVQEEDEFDKLLQQQIDLARSTPAPNSAKKPSYDGSSSPKDKRTTSLMMPKATSSPSINNEQRERMLRSRKLAEERRLARLKTAVNTTYTDSTSGSQTVSIENGVANMEHTDGISKVTEEIAINKKHNRSNVIDSSDEDTALETCVSIAVDVHAVSKIIEDSGIKENEKSTHYVINKDHFHTEVMENTIENSVNTIVASNSRINEVIESTNENGAIVEVLPNTSVLNHENNNDSLNVTGNISEKSDDNEPLRYDDSDMNVDTNDHNTSHKNVENSNDSYREETTVIRDIENIAIGFDKEASIKSEENKLSIYDSDMNIETNDRNTSDKNVGNTIKSNNSNSEQTCVTSDTENMSKGLDKDALNFIEILENNKIDGKSTDKENDETKIVPEEIVEDVMEVDFTDDF